MSVLIGHASISENGTINGTKGDSTGKEVCTRTWYSKPWDFMAIHPDASVREKHAAAIEAACANDNIGYGQSDRNTLYTQAKAVNYVLSKITTKCNCDCSSLQNVAAVASGASGVTYGSNGWTTSTMKSALTAAGYKIITDSTYLLSEAYCVRGAIYVKAGSHTVCGLSNGSSYTKTLAKAGISTGSTTATSTGSTHTVAKGDTLSAIAKKYGTTVSAIVSANKSKYSKITANYIVVGWKLTIPASTSSGSSNGTSTSSSTVPTYKVGSTYTLQVDNLTVRTGAGTNYSKVSFSKLTTNAKANAYSTGGLKKGTKVTCKATKKVGNNVWMQIPSGYIAAYYNGKVYVK